MRAAPQASCLQAEYILKRRRRTEIIAADKIPQAAEALKSDVNAYLCTHPMKDFAAIDFETANRHPASVCSVGVVIVRGGTITDRLYSLIKPRPNYYSHWNTAVHGLTAWDTDDALPFPQVWADIAPYLYGLPLAAHNSPFDERCLRAAHELYSMPYPDYRFHCTCRASRRMFGRELPNHRLPTVAARCGYDLSEHHNALADAEACAVIAMQII